jgi:hypothetical protein
VYASGMVVGGTEPVEPLLPEGTEQQQVAAMVSH